MLKFQVCWTRHLKTIILTEGTCSESQPKQKKLNNCFHRGDYDYMSVVKWKGHSPIVTFLFLCPFPSSSSNHDCIPSSLVSFSHPSHSPFWFTYPFITPSCVGAAWKRIQIPPYSTLDESQIEKVSQPNIVFLLRQLLCIFNRSPCLSDTLLPFGAVTENPEEVR